MRPSTVVLGFISLSAATQATPRKFGKGLTASAFTSNNPSLVLRQSCNIGQTECDSTYCMPDTGTCCGDGIGSYCPLGKYCVSSGCCPKGQTCTGGGIGGGGGSSSSDDDDDDDNNTSACDSDEEKCGDYRCMPKGSVCCKDTGWYCDAGETCDGVLCKSGSGGGSSSDDDDDDSSSDDSTLCKRKGGKGGGGGGHIGGGGGGDDDECAAAGIAIPALLAGVAAAVPLLL